MDRIEVDAIAIELSEDIKTATTIPVMVAVGKTLVKPEGVTVQKDENRKMKKTSVFCLYLYCQTRKDPKTVKKNIGENHRGLPVVYRYTGKIVPLVTT